MSLLQRTLPQATQSTQAFWQAAREHKLLIQKCNSCQRLQFYPRLFCVTCLSEDTDWRESAGEGVIYTFTINHRAANEYMKNHVPYAVAMINLKEGVKMMGNIVNSRLEDIQIGAPVKVVFEKISDDMTLPQFELTQR